MMLNGLHGDMVVYMCFAKGFKQAQCNNLVYVREGEALQGPSGHRGRGETPFSPNNIC